MATLAVSLSTTEPGAQLRELARQLNVIAGGMPDRVTTGAQHVLTVDNAPAFGNVSIQITAGPYPSSLLFA